MTIIHLVDSVEYAETNCYQHQLTHALRSSFYELKTVSLSTIRGKCDAEQVVCCLKQRTISKYADDLKRYLGDTPWVIYDQDPWEALKDDSPFKGTYQKVKDSNLRAIALTTKHFANMLRDMGLPGEFVKMGMLPQYCDAGPSFEERSAKVAFIGTLHPRRKRLFDELKKLRIDVIARPNTLGYGDYLRALHDVAVFVHNEDLPIVIDGKHDNMGKGMWIKDVEAAARGCYSIRNIEVGHDSYCADMPTIKFYRDPVEAAQVIRSIIQMSPTQRALDVKTSVDLIKRQNSWVETAHRLVELNRNT